MINVIQIFEDNEFNKRLSNAIARIDNDLHLSYVNEKLFFEGALSNLKNSIFLFTDGNLAYSKDLYRLSVYNVMIYVYRDDNELVENEIAEQTYDYTISYDFTFPHLYSIMKLAFRYIEPMDMASQHSILPGKLSSGIATAFQLIIDNIPIGLFWKDDQLRYFGCNKRFANDFGLESVNAICGKTDDDLLPEKYSISFASYDNEILKKGESVVDVDKEIVCCNGNKSWLRICKFPIKDRTGKARGIFGVYRNITDSREIEDDLKANQRYLQILMDYIPDTIYFKNRESQFLKINKAQANLLGIANPADAIGKTDFDYFTHEHAKQAFADEQRIMLDGTMLVNHVEHVVAKSGHYRWMLSTKVPILDELGVSVGTVGITRDITEQVQVEQELKAERDLLQTIIDHIPSDIYVKDTDSRFTHANNAKLNSLGLTNPSEINGKSEFDFLTNQIASDTYTDEMSIIATGIPLVNKIEKHTTLDNVVKWISTTKVPYRNDNGKILGLVCISHEITEQVQAREQLEIARGKAEEASVAKSQFLANMSHEIRTPMNGVIGMAEVLSNTDLTSEQRTLINVLIRSGNNLLAIINDILDFSKIESGSIELEEIPFNIQTVVNEVLEMLSVDAISKGIFLKTKYDQKLPDGLVGDAFRIKQVLTNLAHNAIKFTENGEVSIEVINKKNTDNQFCIEFRVNDTGIGISMSEIGRLFEAFTQADPSTTRKYGGTGLGLAISSKLVEKMGGELQVESQLGRGSSFYFEICLTKSVNKVDQRHHMKWSL